MNDVTFAMWCGDLTQRTMYIYIYILTSPLVELKPSPRFLLHRNLPHLRDPPVRGSRIFSRDRVSFRSLFWKLIFEDAFRSRCIHPMLRRYRSVQLRRVLLRTCFGIYVRKTVFEMRFLSEVVFAFVFVLFCVVSRCVIFPKSERNLPPGVRFR